MTIKRQKHLIVLFLSLMLMFSFCITSATAAEDKPMRIQFHRQAQATGIKVSEAAKFATEIYQYFKKNYPETNPRLYSEIFGRVGTFYWFSEYQDLAALEKFMNALRNDPGYMAILRTGYGLFIDGSVHDTLMLRIE